MSKNDDQMVLLEDDENEGPDDFKLSLGDFKSVFVAPSDWTVGTIFGLIGKQIDLDPKFQRRNVWSKEAKSRFIESLFLGVPIPQILLSSKAGEKNNFLVLDGKQRLISIKEFVDGRFLDGTVFKLQRMRILKDELEGKSWSEISENESWKSRFENETLRTVVLRGWSVEEVLYEVFYRLNSGSVKLSPMELRMSLHPGDFLQLIISWTEAPSELHTLLGRRSPDPRMSDVELAVRFLGFYLGNEVYRGNLKAFLDDVCKNLNKRFSRDDGAKLEVENALFEMCEAIKVGITVFGIDKFCRKYVQGGYERRFNRAIFDVLVGALSDPRVRTVASKQPSEFVELYQEVAGSQSFLKSVESTTKSIEATKYRFQSFYGALEAKYAIDLKVPKIEFSQK